MHPLLMFQLLMTTDLITTPSIYDLKFNSRRKSKCILSFYENGNPFKIAAISGLWYISGVVKKSATQHNNHNKEYKSNVCDKRVLSQILLINI